MVDFRDSAPVDGATGWAARVQDNIRWAAMRRISPLPREL